MPIHGKHLLKNGTIRVTKTRKPVAPSARPAGTDRLTSLEREVYDLMLRAFDRVPARAYETMLEDKTGWQYEAIFVGALMSVQEELADVLHRQLLASGQTEAIDVGKQLANEFKVLEKATTPTPSQLALGFRFDVNSKQALDWAKREAGSLITNMGAEQKKVIGQLIGQSMTEGLTRQQTSTAVHRLLNDIIPGTEYGKVTARTIGANMNGLTARYEQAVWNRAQKTAQDLADRGITGTKAVEALKKDTDKYSEKLRKARARTIARTEIIRAAEEGRQQSWDQAISKGLINKTTATKTWRAGPYDVCPICSRLHGTSVPIQGEWGNGVRTPPAHPNCRCSMVLNSGVTEPPRRIGDGTTGNPFKLDFPGPPNPDDFPPLPSGPGPVAPPAPTPAPLPPPAPTPTPVAPEATLTPAPAPTAPAPTAPVGQGLTPESLDDLRAQVDRLDNTALGIEQIPGTKQARQARPDTDGQEALDALKQAGDRIDSRYKALLKERNLPDPEELDNTAITAKETVERLGKQAEADKLATYQEVVREFGLEMTPGEVGLGGINAQSSHARRVAREINTKWYELLRTELDAKGIQRTEALVEELNDRAVREVLGERLYGLASKHTDTPYVETKLSRVFSDLVGSRPSATVSQHAEAKKVLEDLEQLIKENSDAWAEALRDTIREVRPDFGSGRIVTTSIKGGKVNTAEKISDSIDEASRFMPTSWVDAINDKGYSVGVADRAYHQGRTVKTTLKAERLNSVTLHEFSHAAESDLVKLQKANNAFYASQTADEKKLRSLATLTGEAFGKDERCLPDEFGDLYASKWYGGPDGWKQYWPKGSFETITRGMESLFHQGTMNHRFVLRGEYRRFMLGILGLI